MIFDYVIISDTNPERLMRKIVDYSRQGWECQGGVNVVLQLGETQFNMEAHYYQAMVNPVTEKSDGHNN